MKRFRRIAPALLLGAVGGCVTVEREPEVESLYPLPSPADVHWHQVLSRLRPLENERGDRWPLVLWDGVGFEPLKRRQIGSLLKRGIVQHLRLSRPDLDAARALVDARAPVVLMEGAAGAWPYSTVKGKEWRLQFAPDASVHPSWRDLADPTLTAGWESARDRILGQLREYKSAGLKVDAVWLDYEGALLHDDHQALRASTAAGRVPRGVLEDEARYRAYRRAHWLHGLSRYVAAPVRRVYPDVSVTNWVVMVSSSMHPVLSWGDWPHPPSPPLFFTHTNPIAYGMDTYFLTAWPPGHDINRDNVDRFYIHLLLRQVSTDALNRAKLRPDMGAVAWVARWVPNRPEHRVPMMSRVAYREALRHIWLRGVDAMQVFNPPREGFERYAIQEVQDVQQVYDEMLAYRDFLEQGEAMNFHVPNNRDALILWSGLRLGGRALVRLTNLGAKQERAYICFTVTWCKDLDVPRHGRTDVLEIPETAG